MHNILVIGAGKVGSLIAYMLADSGAYTVHLADIQDPSASALLPFPHVQTHQLDVSNEKSFAATIQGLSPEAVISCLPYYHNVSVAKMAKQFGLHYFDTTEDAEVGKTVRALANGEEKAFVSHCGLAPGFINIVAKDLMRSFDELEVVKLRAGCLPVASDNALKYALTWSTDGLINEYGNICYGIVDGRVMELQPLEGLETVEMDGIAYEAFNTSGGIGTLVSTCEGKVRTLNYKTLRYPGHCEKMRFLMSALKLNEDRATLKKILEKALPMTGNDVALCYVSVKGQKRGGLVEESYVNKIYSQSILDKDWSAIQVTTASGVCTLVDLVLTKPTKYHGPVLQEDFTLKEVLENRFAKVFKK